MREAYEEALCRSFVPWRERLSDYTAETLYFGGGTPSLATREGIGRIFRSLRENFSISKKAEITVEMNPESASREVLEAWREAGANRISFGLQSALDSELATLGRLHTALEGEQAVKRAKEAGFSRISVDLMYGLPNQTLSDFQISLEKVLSLGVEHISFYLLTLSSCVPLYQEKNRLPSDEVVREMYLFAHKRLEREGFSHYEVSNAALCGGHSRHNEIYWTGGDYLGFGPGAHSFFEKKRFFVREGIEEFISASNPLDRIEEGQPIKGAEEREEYLMLSLRRKEGLAWKRLLALSDEDFCRKIKEKVLLWQQHGLCRETQEGFALTAEGFFVSNEIITQLISIE